MGRRGEGAACSRVFVVIYVAKLHRRLFDIAVVAALSLFSLSLPFAGGGGGGDKVACFAVMYANCIEGSSVSLSRRFRLFFS